MRTRFERRADRLLARFFIAAFAAAATTIAVVFLWLNRGAWTTADDVVVANSAAVVRDARTLIATRIGHMVPPTELPPSLRIRGLMWANIHHGHIDLVIARNPDISMGARIWPPQHGPHHDRPTRYRDIYFYRYEHEAPVSADNLP